MGLRICMLALLGITALAVLRQWRSELLPLLRVALVVTLGVVLLEATVPLVEYLKLLGESGVGAHAELLLRGLGIAWLTHYAAEVCRESGENGVASGVELAGRVELLLLALPLCREILALAERLLSAGGAG